MSLNLKKDEVIIFKNNYPVIMAIQKYTLMYIHVYKNAKIYKKVFKYTEIVIVLVFKFQYKGIVFCNSVSNFTIMKVTNLTPFFAR